MIKDIIAHARNAPNYRCTPVKIDPTAGTCAQRVDTAPGKPRTPRRPVRLSSPQPRAGPATDRPTPRLRHLRRAATQQAGKVSSAGNEGLSAGIVGSSGDGVGRRTAARPSP